MAAPPASPDVQPLYYEVEAAKILRVPPRALRSERTAGRITYRKVAGRIMYRADDLIAWQELIARPALPRDRNTDPIPKTPTASVGNGDGAESVRRLLATTERLRKAEQEKKREQRARDREEAEAAWRASKNLN